jgi:hypothetical protein
VGTLSYAKRGLIPATTTAASVTDDPTNNFNTDNPDGNQGITVHDLSIPAGTQYARISLFDAFTDGEDDLDLYVYRVHADSTKTLVGLSGGGTAAEEVNLVAPGRGGVPGVRPRLADRWAGRELHAVHLGPRGC